VTNRGKQTNTHTHRQAQMTDLTAEIKFQLVNTGQDKNITT